MHVREVKFPEIQRREERRWLRERLAGISLGLAGGLFGGLIAAVLWIHEPTAAAAPLLRPADAAVGATEPDTDELVAEAEADEPAQWWKRPTPMEPGDAARHLAMAWEEVVGGRASAKIVSVLWAQWALETGRGRWMVDHNFAGLKGRAPGGGSAMWWTWEETDDGPKRIRGRFRAYSTPGEGARDYVEMLQRRYPECIEAARRGDTPTFILTLERRGYFTEKPDAYGRAVGSLAREFMRGELSSQFAD